MVLTNDMLDTAVESVQNQADSNFSHGAVGTGTTDESASDSSLENEILRKARANFTSTSVSSQSGSITMSTFINSTEANGNSITEFGIFDSSSGGNLKAREVFSAVDKNSQIELFIDFNLDIEAEEV